MKMEVQRQEHGSLTSKLPLDLAFTDLLEVWFSTFSGIGTER